MKMLVMAIRDTQVSTYGTPFFTINEIQASRSLQQAVNDESTQLAHFPEHFELVQLGEYDDVTGVIEQLDRPKFIISAQSLVKIDYRKKLEADLQNITPTKAS